MEVYIPQNGTVTEMPMPLTIFLYTYNFGIIFAALIGNSLVIYASGKFHAISTFDASSVILVEFLAVTDIILTLIGYIPKLLTLFAGKWILGKVVCFITAYGQFAPGAAEILLLTSIAALRCNLIAKPAKNAPGPRCAKIMVAAIWSVSLATSIVFLVVGNPIAVFDPRILSCVTNVPVAQKELSLAMFIVFAFFPFILTLGMNVYSLGYSLWYRRHRTPALRQNTEFHFLRGLNAVLTVNAICIVFGISWIPYITRVFLAMGGIQPPSWFFLLQYNLNILSLALNPIIYTVVNRKFRRFIIRKVLRMGSQQRVRSGTAMNYSVTSPRQCSPRVGRTIVAEGMGMPGVSSQDLPV